MKRAFTIVELMIVCFILAVLLAVAVPMWVQSRETSRRNACLANMQKIENAKDIFAMENRLSTGDSVTAAQIAPQFIKGIFPSCPSAGTYTVNTIGTHTECSTHGVLP